MFKHIVRRIKGFWPERLDNLPFPPVINVESTNGCNADCIMCPSRTTGRKVGIMDFEIFKKIVDECSQYRLRYFGLHLFGEPLLDKGIFRKVEYAKKNGIANVGFFTNGSLLDRNTAEEIVRLGLDHITISFDGATKKTYEKIRVNLKFEDVTRNVHRLINIRNSCSAKKPRVSIVFTRMGENGSEEKDFINNWKGVADYVRSSDTHDWGGLVEGRVLKNFSSCRHPCSRLWLNPVVLYDGDLALCCLDFEGGIRLGSVKNNSIFELWNSEKVIELRRMHLNGNYEKIELCKNCNAWRWLDPWWWG